MGFPPAWWHRYRSAFWAGPDYLRGGRARQTHFLISIAGTVWLYGFLRRKCSLTALFLLPVLAVGGLYCLIVPQAVMLLWLHLLISLWVTALVSSFLFRPRGELHRSFPERVRAGEVFTVRFTLRNRRKIRLYDVLFDPFGYGRLLQKEVVPALPVIRAEEKAECTVQVRAVRRGIVHVYRPIAESSFPLGLVKWSVRGQEQQKLLIYPAFTPLEVFSLPRGKVSRSTGSTVSVLPGESPDLLGSRDFRPGDAIRHIDWPGSARKGELVVKEFAREEFLRIAVIADTCPPRIPVVPPGGESRELEAAMSLAAALAEHLLRHGTSVDLLAAGGQMTRIEAGTQRSGFQQVCDLLAAVEPEPSFRAPEWADALLPELRKTAAAILFLLDDTPERRAFADKIARSGVPLNVILLAEHPSGKEVLPENWRRIRPEEVFGGTVTAL